MARRYRFERFVDTQMEVMSRSGDEWVVRCPRPENHKHGDRNPSCGINVRTGAWLCFSCGARGGVSTLEKLYHSKAQSGVDDELLHGLRQELAEARPSTRVEQANIYPESWLNQFDTPTGYWRKRGFDDEFAAEHRLGYDLANNAVTIPIRTLDERVVGVIRRHLDPDAKPRYKYPKGFRVSRYVWGAWRGNGDVLAITEGTIDSMALWQIGVDSVALLGSHISEHQARIVRGLGATTIVSALDNDRAGQRGTHELHEQLPGVQHLVVWRFGKKAKDVADLDPAMRRRAIRSALPYHEWRKLEGVAPPPPKHGKVHAVRR